MLQSFEDVRGRDRNTKGYPTAEQAVERQPGLDSRLDPLPSRGPTRKRARRTVETTEFAAVMRRMLRAYASRVTNADVEDLADLIALGVELDNAIAAAAAGSRERWGRSWADIARAAGTSRQAAQQRWGHPRPDINPFVVGSGTSGSPAIAGLSPFRESRGTARGTAVVG